MVNKLLFTTIVSLLVVNASAEEERGYEVACMTNNPQFSTANISDWYEMDSCQQLDQQEIRAQADQLSADLIEVNCR